MEVENTDSVVENKAEQIEHDVKQVDNALEPEIKPAKDAKGEPLPIYAAKDKHVT